MELLVWLFPLGERSRARLVELLPASRLVFKSGRCALPVSDPLLPRVLAGGDGFWVAGQSVFSRSELSRFRHFEAVCRRVVPEGKRDHEKNLATVEATPKFGPDGTAGIRLVRGFVLTRITLKPNVVAAIGGWTNECVVGSEVAQAVREAGFSGFQLLPVTHPKTGVPYADFSHLFTEAILPPATLDPSVETIRSRFPEENGALRHLGCLSYAAGDLYQRPDFNRSAEPWASWWGFPSWVVSARVAALFKRAKLSGWHFRPVLEVGSATYDQYLRSWQELAQHVAEGEKTTFDGGRW